MKEYKTMKRQKWTMLWDQIYDELDATIDVRSTNRELIVPKKMMYDYDKINTTDDGYIQVCADALEKLDFARQVAEHYNVPFEVCEDKYNSDLTRKYIGTIKVTEDMEYVRK